MRKHTLIALVGELLNLAELAKVETPQTVYQLTMTPAPPDEIMQANIPNKRDDRPYSTNRRHSKQKKSKGR